MDTKNYKSLEDAKREFELLEEKRKNEAISAFERAKIKNQQNVENNKQNQNKEVKDKLESKSNLYCNLMVVLCLIFSTALVILAITEADRYDSSEFLIWCYSISAIMCVVLCIWFRLLRYICKAILILLNNDCNRCNPEGNHGQQS